MEENNNLTVGLSSFKGTNVEKAFYNPAIIEKAENTQQYADVIYMRGGSILLLCRSKEDSFEPNKYGLPGGKIDAGETPKVAAVREMFEETGLDVAGNVITGRQYGPCSYFFSYCEQEDPQIVLDEDEHYQYRWMTKVEIANEPADSFILDLKKRLCEMLYI